MRIITGDECGLLKEIIPELCRPSLMGCDDDKSSSSSSLMAIHAGRARPSATSIQAAASSYGNYYNSSNNVAVGGGGKSVMEQRGVQRIESNNNTEIAMSRERGIVSLAFLPPSNTRNSNSNNDDNNASSPSFKFAALRMNGIVETWCGNRVQGSCTARDGDEGNVTAALYAKHGGSVNGVLPSSETTSDSDNSNDDNNGEEETKNNNNNTTGGKGWYTNQPVRPIGMVSNYEQSSTTTSTTNNPILATLDSIGNISILNPNDLSLGILSTYNAFLNDTTNNDSSMKLTLPTPSSSKNDTNSLGTLTYTKGRFANNHIATCLAMGGGDDNNKLAVGGRERGMRVLDLESGKLLWKAKNLPPDPQTLLQQPMWTTSIQFLHTPTSALSSSSSSSGGGGGTNLLATGTAYKQVQIYDIRTSASSSATSTRRPVLYTPEHLLSHRITSVCQLSNGNTLAIGDSIGDVHLLDMRKMHSGKSYNSTSNKRKSKEEIGLGRLVGPGGSIKQLCVHPTLPYVACVGLDRKLWTWDVTKRKMMDCIYLKQRLNCFLFCEDESWNNNENDDDGGGSDGENEFDIGGEEGGMENVRERELEEDEVEDYVDSDDDDDDDDAGGEKSKRGNSGSGSSSEETESESDDEEEADGTIIPSTKRRKK